MAPYLCDILLHITASLSLDMEEQLFVPAAIFPFLEKVSMANYLEERPSPSARFCILHLPYAAVVSRIVQWADDVKTGSVVAKKKFGAYAMKRVAAGSHLPTSWLSLLVQAPGTRIYS